MRYNKYLGKIRYYRLHGIGGYRYKYTEDLILLERFLEEKTDAYVMFNNASMYDDAQAFKELIS